MQSRQFIMALDLMLKNLIASSQFNQLRDKNWSTLSKLIPGTTARQWQQRYDELLKEVNLTTNQGTGINIGSTRTSGTGVVVRSIRDDGTSEGRSSRPGSGKTKGSKGDKDTASKASTVRPLSAELGPTMVIRVCDEAKNVKQDFKCPRDLLVQEMRYFAEYFATDAQRWEDVDISVHCDVQIFDWLMKYVKRNTKEAQVMPELESGNVVSILISSEFLKMSSLVQECVEYMHDHLTAIVATPSNMNCISDGLVTRIAQLFDHNEADDIIDKRDKFKSKIFSKWIELMFDASYSNPNSPENASTLYRCSICKSLLTKNLESKVRCHSNRMSVDQQGNLCYSHMHDTTWDINEYLLDLKSQLKSWQHTYWRLWGTINALTCVRCGEMFSCTQLGHCPYHPEQAQFDTAAVVGSYPCCNQKTLRFDPTQTNKGCKVRDHVVQLPDAEKDDGSKESGTSGEGRVADKRHIYNDLLKHREAICEPYEKIFDPNEETSLDIFSVEEQACGLRGDNISTTSSQTNLSDDGNTKSETRPQPRLQALTIEREVSCDDESFIGDSEDDDGEEEDTKSRRHKFPRRSRVTVDPEAILVDGPDFSTIKQRKWDSSRSLRWNQDAQREEDQRRMNEIIAYLSKLRLNADKMEKLRHKEYAGGIFSKLEAQWKAVNIPPLKPPSTQFRNKPRLSQLKLCKLNLL